MALLNRSDSSTHAMRAVARQREKLTHDVKVGDHSLTVDEPTESGAAEAAFFMRGTPVSQVRDVAATGESMPPKSTYFFPKVLTGMVFNPLDD